jgi:hypothetical protein
MNSLQFSVGLRALADAYEKCSVDAPDEIRIYMPWSMGRENVRAFAKEMAPLEKPKTENEYSYELLRTFEGLAVRFMFDRSNVCRKVLKMVLSETWECPDSLLDAEADHSIKDV